MKYNRRGLIQNAGGSRIPESLCDIKRTWYSTFLIQSGVITNYRQVKNPEKYFLNITGEVYFAGDNK